MKTFDYHSSIVWTGNRGKGTADYHAFERSWDITIPGKPIIHCSNDPLLGGDAAKMNPEDLLLSALASCHMLWFLHYAAEARIVVHEYADNPVGTGEIGRGGAGRFIKAVLHPLAVVDEGTDLELAQSLHQRIHEVCFIARSLNFPVEYKPTFQTR